LFKKINITIKFVADLKPELFAEAIDENTRGIFVESISNPSLILAPIAELAQVRYTLISKDSSHTGRIGGARAQYSAGR
jgi:O-acetylhomoserine/O-acetylserine sulfhydrylase-like pyridoxal-dependent enzyme